MNIIHKPVIVFAWGDNSGLEDGRPEYTIDQINNGDLGDTITFNSITDGAIGNEFNFVGARELTDVDLGKDNIWKEDDITVEDGKTYILRLYAHNNSPNGRNGMAKDVKVSFNIPGETATKIQVDGFISSSNATPTEYWDYVNFNSEHPFHLEYIDGSARLANKGVGNVENADGRGGITISDDILKSASGGTSIGFDSVESGEVPGCYEFNNIVTVLVKAVYDTPYTITKSVRPAGTKGNNWTDQLEVNVGDEVEYQIEYKNTSDEMQRDVMLRDLLPDNMEYVASSTKVWDEFSTGDKIEEDDLVTEKGINLGNYGPGANAFIRFNAKVVDKNLTDGTNVLVSWGQGTVNNALIQDNANLTVRKISKTKIAIIVLFILLMICMINNIRLRAKLRSYE